MRGCVDYMCGREMQRGMTARQSETWIFYASPENGDHRNQNRPPVGTRGAVTERGRPIPLVVLAVRESPTADGPGSLDAGRGSVDPAPEPGAAIREGGRSPLAPTADLRTAALADAAREMPEGALTCLAGTAVALRGTLRSLDGRVGRWMPAAANRDPS